LIVFTLINSISLSFLDSSHLILFVLLH
jgi:hypothetical protein